MRKLASIQQIAAVVPIPGADKIEVAQIGGWNVVVKKGEFKEGDLGVYFEIDSFLPAAHPAFEFLAKDAKERDGVMRVRLKTIRLRKQLSQGLILPISSFPELSKSVLGLRVLTEGDDVSELLNVEKYETPEERSVNSPATQRSRTSPWPFFLQKTDQERVQNVIPQVQSSAQNGESFELTVKLDGSSMTVYALRKDSPHFAEAFKKQAKKYESEYVKSLSVFGKIKHKVKRLLGEPAPTPSVIYGVCSRNIDLDLDGDSHFAKYVQDNNVIQKIEVLSKLYGSIALQGELVAPQIQGNYEKVDKPEWYIYDVYNIDKQSYLLPEDARVATLLADQNYVPVISEHLFLKQEEEEDISGRDLVDMLLACAEGDGMNPGVNREGLVAKSNTTSFSFKIISNSYLEKKG